MNPEKELRKLDEVAMMKDAFAALVGEPKATPATIREKAIVATEDRAVEMLQKAVAQSDPGLLEVLNSVFPLKIFQAHALIGLRDPATRSETLAEVVKLYKVAVVGKATIGMSTGDLKENGTTSWTIRTGGLRLPTPDTRPAV